MDWITDGIALGDRRDAQDAETLRAEGVRAVLQLYHPDPDPETYPFAEAVRLLNVDDGEPLKVYQLRSGVRFVRKQLRLDRRVFVHCAAGRSRSPTFVAACLHEEGMPLFDAFQLVLARRPCVLPHPALVCSLVEYYRIEEQPAKFFARLIRARGTIGCP